LATVIVTELDDFKRVNNTMGHTAGDELLVAVGQRLRQAVAGLGDETARPMVARLGGDEFAVWGEGGHPERTRNHGAGPPAPVVPGGGGEGLLLGAGPPARTTSTPSCRRS